MSCNEDNAALFSNLLSDKGKNAFEGCNKRPLGLLTGWYGRTAKCYALYTATNTGISAAVNDSQRLIFELTNIEWMVGKGKGSASETINCATIACVVFAALSDDLMDAILGKVGVIKKVLRICPKERGSEVL